MKNLATKILPFLRGDAEGLKSDFCMKKMILKYTTRNTLKSKGDICEII